MTSPFRGARAGRFALGLLLTLLAACAQRPSDGPAAELPMAPPVAVAVSGSIPGMSHDALLRIVDVGVAWSERGGCSGLGPAGPEPRMQWSVLDNRPKLGIAVATVQLYEGDALLRQSATRIHDPSAVSPSTAIRDFAAISARVLGCGPVPHSRDL